MAHNRKYVVMIDNYDSFTWNLYQYLSQSPLCEKVDVYRNDEIDIATIRDVLQPDIIFISPGPGHPTSDSGISRDVIREFKGKLPVFGVCMGQQCIFEVFGGEVKYAGEIVHGKTTTVKHDGKGMFYNVPQSVAVTRYHSLAGSVSTLPDCLEITATTETSPEIIMGVRHKQFTVEGVQFHPESILTESGQIMIDNVLRVTGGTWKENDENLKLASKSFNSKSEDILQKIYKQRVADYKIIQDLPGKSFEQLEILLKLGLAPKLINFYDRLILSKNQDKSPILSEFKRASPSKGIINGDANAAQQGYNYAINGASAISVLTEPTWFKGSIEDMTLVRKIVETPTNENYSRPAILRKEFIFNKYQILESRLAGADTLLLIVKMLNNFELLQNLYTYSISLGMIPLVEINNADELKQALKLQYNNDSLEPLILGVNNRNLTNFDVDLKTTTNLVEESKNSSRKGDVLVLALSGITSVDDVKNYKSQNVDGFLIGESLMRSEKDGKLESFLNELCNC